MNSPNYRVIGVIFYNPGPSITVWSAADFDVMYYSVAVVSFIGRSMYLYLQDKIYGTKRRHSKFHELNNDLIFAFTFAEAW